MGNVNNLFGQSSTNYPRAPNSKNHNNNTLYDKWNQYFENDPKNKLVLGVFLTATIVSFGSLYFAQKHYRYKRLVEYFHSNRRFIYVSPKLENNKSIRFMSYNILADGYSYALNKRHSYLPLRYRAWNYRLTRILAQVTAYAPDIIAVQESTYNTFHNGSQSLQFQFSILGYKGIHVTRDVEGQKLGNSAQTDCIFYNKEKFDLIQKSVVRFNNVSKSESYNKYFGTDKNSKFHQKLNSCPDVCIILHLRFKQSMREFIATSSHLYWNPKHPHLKTAQILILNHTLRGIIEDEWKLDINEIPIVLGIDANSMPFKLESDEFDCNLEKHLAIAKESKSSDERNEHLMNDNSDIFMGGVYRLMTTGYLPIIHYHHPKTRIFERAYHAIYYERKYQRLMSEMLENEEIKEDILVEEKKNGRIAQIFVFFYESIFHFGKKEKNIPLVDAMDKELKLIEKQNINIEEIAEEEKDRELWPILKEIDSVSDIVDYEIDICWKSVYATVTDKEPIFTTKVPHFNGTIDYIFINDGFRVLSYLEMPYANKLDYHLIDTQEIIDGTVDNEEKNNYKQENGGKSQINEEIENADQFPYLPNKMYPSDHLALACDLQLMPTEKQTLELLKQFEH